MLVFWRYCKSTRHTRIWQVLMMVLWSALALPGVQAAPSEKAFKVCADPHSLPSSNKQRAGYENRIAALFAESLDLPLEFEWFPQRMGFIRNTLRNNDTADGSYKCDIVMGVVDNFELAATTKPYFRSTWAMVYVQGTGFDHIRSGADLIGMSKDERAKLKIGVFDRSPASAWLHKYDFLSYIVPYPMMAGDARSYPGQIIDKDLVAGTINMTFVWGPIAGYFAHQIKDQKIVVIPMSSEPRIKFDYRIAMAVRFGERAWKAKLNELIDHHQSKINAILSEYGVPLLGEK